MEKDEQILPEETEWVIRVVTSCENPIQMELCEKLIENYTAMFKDHPIKHIKEVFHKKAIQTNYYHHKAVKTEEKIR